MSGVLSKATELLSRLADLPSPLIQHITEHAGISENKARIVTSVLGASACLITWKLLLAPSSKLPPGPRPLPLIGNLAMFNKDPKMFVVLDEIKQQYGDMFTFYFGPRPYVFLNTAELVREAYMRQSAATSNRTWVLAFEIFSDDRNDIVGANYGPRVQMQRKLAHQALRKFSMGGGLAQYTLKAFQKLCGELDKNPVLVGEDMAFLFAYNILVSMCFGKSFEFDDPFFQEMVRLTKEQDEAFESFSLSDFLPIFRFLPLSDANRKMLRLLQKFNAYFDEMLEEHKNNFNKDKLTDFTYHLLNAKQEAENNPDDRNSMKLLDARHYALIMRDLFFAGTDTTRMTLNWIWHYLAAFPEVQKKAQEEINSVLGRDGEVTADCREQLPYVDAVLHEVMRIKTVAPMGIFHETSEDIQLGGYDIPKGTALVSNTWSIHLDEKNWENAEAFLPERWLDENGKYVFQQNGFVPFSMGRRSCIGESFVKTELHLVTTMMLQRYTLEPTEGYRVNLDMAPFLAPKPFDQKPLVAKRR